MGRYLINRPQLCRLMLWIENQPYQRSLSSSTTSTIFSLTRFRQCSTMPDSETLNTPLSADFRNNEEEIEKERANKHEMVRKISRNVEIMTFPSRAKGGVCDVYLVGTVHISQKSCTEVQEIIKFLKPEVVFLEMCESRKGILTSKNPKIPTIEETVENISREANLFGVVLKLVNAASYEKHKVIPGYEFRVAYEEAIKYGSRVTLGDRPRKITIQRTWSKMPLWEKAKFILFPLVKRLDPTLKELEKKLKSEYDKDTLALYNKKMSEHFPSFMETFVNERDQYMSHTLLKEALKSSSVVAVVGKAHLQGIEKHCRRNSQLSDEAASTS